MNLVFLCSPARRTGKGVYNTPTDRRPWRSVGVLNAPYTYWLVIDSPLVERIAALNRRMAGGWGQAGL
jgi:hypothetical protein